MMVMLDKNLNKFVPKQQVIFPDEEDSDEASCSKFSHSDSSENGSVAYVALESGECLPQKKLQEWKRTSPFRACKVLTCDPLQKFTGEPICLPCRKLLRKIYSKMCLTWRRKELRTAIVDYLYFHAILVFDLDAEANFSKENPDHPYLMSYKRVRELNLLVVKSFGAAHAFDLRVTAAVKEHSKMYCEQLKTSTKFCEICYCVATKKYVLGGRSYNRNNFKLLKRIEGVEKTQDFCFCREHALLFTTYYYISHMDWIVHWNCYNLVCNSLGGRYLTAEQIINLINPISFRNLATFFKVLYDRLDRLSYVEYKTKPHKKLGDWCAIVKKWKRSLIYQYITEKASSKKRKISEVIV